MSAHKKAMLSFIDESKRVAMTLAKTPKARAQCETIFAALRYGIEHDDDEALAKLERAAMAIDEETAP